MSLEQVPEPSDTNVWSGGELDPGSKATQEIFTVQDVDNEIVKRFQPEFIARGGEHAVYALSGLPDMVAKANLHSVETVMRYNQKEGYAADHLNMEDTNPESVKNKAERKIANEHIRVKRLREYFGKERVLAQKQYLMKVPMNGRILKYIFGKEEHASPSEAWAVVTLQRKTEVLQDPSHLSLKAGYAEKDPRDVDAYQRQTEKLFVHPEDPGYSGEDFAEFLEVQNSSHLKKLIEQSNTDKELSLLLADFTHRAIKYTKETGEILDLAGRDNIALFQKDGQWEYQLIDALYPIGNRVVEDGAKVARHIRKNILVEDHDRTILLNVVNYVRTINALAKHFGMNEVIDILDPNTKKVSIDYLLEIRKGVPAKHWPQTLEPQ